MNKKEIKELEKEWYKMSIEEKRKYNGFEGFKRGITFMEEIRLRKNGKR